MKLLLVCALFLFANFTYSVPVLEDFPDDDDDYECSELFGVQVRVKLKKKSAISIYSCFIFSTVSFFARVFFSLGVVCHIWTEKADCKIPYLL